MKNPKLLLAISICTLTWSPSAIAQEKGPWSAANKTARSITGDVVLSNDKIAINFVSFPMAQIRPLDPAETSALFNPDEAPAAGASHLYRLSIPATQKFLRKNTLCGSDDTQWLVTYVSGRTLELAFFSGDKMPVFTLDAVSNSTSLCGIYSYSR
jgi:hypothetical protein